MRRHGREAGFTLTELMVTLLVIAILVAIAIASLLGARRAAQDRAAQSLARESLASAKTLFQADEDYTAASVTELRAAEPSIVFVPAPVTSSGPHEASVDAPDRVTFISAVLAKTGTCFYIRDEAVPVSGGTSYASKASDGTDCTADSPPAVFERRW